MLTNVTRKWQKHMNMMNYPLLRIDLFTWNANIITHNLYQRAVDIAYEARLAIQKTKVLIQKNKNTSKNIQRFGVIERRKKNKTK